ncbi:hypothetical protein IKG10_00835 [Candidatus Saccharibacteria bacterium]|nr:hypothetical protein [Candidatus Saccharibacteria bacterium]
MDPTNNNPTTTPNPSPEPQLSGAGQPASETPIAPNSANESPVLQPISQNPATQPIQPQSTPPQSVPGVTPPPVAPNPPVVNPPVNPIVNPGVTLPQNGVGATDAILRPEPVAPPDPVEEELKAPMRAAAPVPGSIGSAVSGPTDEVGDTDKPTPSVSFNDPATEPIVSSSDPSQQPQTPKKTNHKTLIALIIVAVIVVIALGAVLAMQLLNNPTPNPNTSSDTSNSSNSSYTPSVSDDAISEPDQNDIDSNNTNAVSSKISCTRTMTSEELANFNGAVSGSINVSSKYSGDKLSSIELIKTVTYSSENTEENEPVDEVAESVMGDEITATNAPTFYLSVSEDKTIDLTKSGIQKNYELLDFVCEEL